MVAIINTGHSVRRIFNYNENKVSQGIAHCIGEGNYPMDVDQMSLNFKIKFLLKQLELNENVTRNSVHISLNFDPAETSLSKEKLMEIAASYMTKIGFGQQPYLVYQHHDAGHQHIHIISIKVKQDGKRIDMQNIGRNQSETARKTIEAEFNLVRASSKNQSNKIKLEPINIQKITYGNLESKKAINAVLNAIIPTYKFTTLGELNAVLNLYNVNAEQGKENSRMFIHKGLLYQIITDNKLPVGVPIKASAFYSKPTLANLGLQFELNKKARIPHLKRVKNSIDLATLNKPGISLPDLEKHLLKDGISMILRKNKEELIYGITYVDHITKCVYNGSVLGPAYSAKGIQYQCSLASKNEDGKAAMEMKQNITSADNPKTSFISESELQKIIDTVLQPEYTGDYISRKLKGKRKKRKRKGQSDNQ